ncbi:MAG TPA: DMT family transporter [Planctomycetaceae bacterium]|nr:DMT family transporter [Planctomycetaceae bacterium]
MQATGREKLLGALALIGCVFCWGVVPVILRQLAPVINAWTANGIRYPLAALCYWPVLWWFYRRHEVDGTLLKRSLVPALFAWLGQVFWGLAPYYLPASAIGFYVRFSMVAALGAAMLLFRDERRLLVTPRFYVGLLLVVGGFLWFSMVQEVDSTHAAATRHWQGFLIMLACSLFFGFYGVSVRYALSDVNPILGFAVVSQFVSVGTITTMLLWGDMERLPALNSTDWFRVASSTLLGISFGHILMYYSVKRLGASITSSVQTLTPFVTAVIALWVLGEVMTADQWAGGIVMVVGALVLIVTQPKKHRPPRPEAAHCQDDAAAAPLEVGVGSLAVADEDPATLPSCYNGRSIE